ncbi:hypothetical protein ACHAWO_000532, partial [Cyclotella atomus]
PSRDEHVKNQQRRKKTEDQRPSLISSLAPPRPAAAEAPKKKPTTNISPRRSPMPTQSPALPPSNNQPGSKNNGYSKVHSPAGAKPSLSQGENRIITNLDKYIDMVSSAIKQKKEKSSASNSVLDRINDGKRDAGKRGGSTDLFGSFQKHIQPSQLLFIRPQHKTTSNPTITQYKTPNISEDFPPNGPKEHPLSWWGIVEPTSELLAMHEHVAEEVGYPIGKRKREDGSSATAQGSDKEEKKIEDENEKVVDCCIMIERRIGQRVVGIGILVRDMRREGVMRDDRVIEIEDLAIEGVRIRGAKG